MAYSKSPTVSTYDTKRIDFVINPMQRSGSLLNKDAKLVNMMVEVVETPNNTNQRIFVKSRPGLALAYATTAGVGRGCYYWLVGGVGYVLSVVGSSVYYNGVFLQTLTTSTGTCGFTEFVNSTGTNTLVLLDGTKGYVFTSPTVAGTEITSVDFPTPHIPIPIFMDGYLFVAKAGTQDIYNSNLDDPSLWTAGDYISAEMYPDKIVALSKNNNYVYAVGSNSVEYFYDAATASGSPLARHDSAVQQFGTAAPSTVVQTEKEVIMIGETGNGGHTVWTIDGFKETEIGTPAIRSVLRVEGANLVNAVAHCTRVSGQKLYIVNLSTQTIVYSFDSKMWSFWNSGPGGTLAFVGKYGTDGPNGVAYIQHESDGDIYTISEDNHIDHDVAFRCRIQTPKYDFDTFNAKFMSRFSLIGDIPDGSGTGNVLQISWSDDDYQTWTTNRDLSFDYDFPCIAQLGRFRRRAFRVDYSQPYLLRLEGFEVDINKGNQ
jgi:hypothetical protein